METQQALTTANLNLEENAQRKAILNSMQGTRVFRGSALSRAVRGNTPGDDAAPGPSASQTSNAEAPIAAAPTSLLDQRESNASGAAGAGGAGASASPSTAGGYRGGGSARGQGAIR